MHLLQVAKGITPNNRMSARKLLRLPQLTGLGFLPVQGTLAEEIAEVKRKRALRLSFCSRFGK